MPAEITVLICEDSIEGIFTAIYEAYEKKYQIDRVKLHVGEEYEPALFTDYQRVYVDDTRAEKVRRTLMRKFSKDDYLSICYALSTTDERKADAVFHTIDWGLRGCYQNSILEHLTCDWVRITMELARNASNEYMHLRGFTRFRELKGGLLYAVIAPKNDILPQLAAHFTDRFPQENFIIRDKGRELYAVHPAYKPWILVTLKKAENLPYGEVKDENVRIEAASGMGIDDCMEERELSDQEHNYQELFREFCHNISIEERKNLNLQRNMLPLHFRTYMTEFYD